MRRLLILLVICVGLGIPLLLRQNVSTKDVPTPQKEIPRTQPTQEEVVIGNPVSFEIPTLNVQSEIEYVGMEESGRMGVPESAYTAGWWKLGVKPGQKGSAVIAGHLDTPQGTPGIFYELDTLKNGDEVTIKDSIGNKLSFVVFDKQQYLDAEFPIKEVFGKDDGSYLNLITCDGTFDKTTRNYDKRYVVFTKLRRS